MSLEPLVAIVTPVYNGASFLGECLDSVLAQTYRNWRHFVIDNKSNDGSDKIIESYAKRDSRLELVRYDAHVKMLDNWNRSLGHVPEDAVYIKQLNADDALVPDSLKMMVSAADRHPDVALVSSYFEFDKRRLPDFPAESFIHEETVLMGRDVAKAVFVDGPDVLATPSVLLLRNGASVSTTQMFNAEGFPPEHPIQPPLCQADKEAYLPILKESGLVFVPKKLTQVRKHMTSATRYSAKVAAWHPSRLELILRHGHHFLTPKELSQALEHWIRKYVRSLTWRILKGALFTDREFVDYQRLALGYLIPRLSKSGHTAQARALKPFALALRARRDKKVGGSS